MKNCIEFIKCTDYSSLVKSPTVSFLAPYGVNIRKVSEDLSTVKNTYDEDSYVRFRINVYNDRSYQVKFLGFDVRNIIEDNAFDFDGIRCLTYRQILEISALCNNCCKIDYPSAIQRVLAYLSTTSIEVFDDLSER